MRINMVGNRLDSDLFMIMNNGNIATGQYDEFNRFHVWDIVPEMHVRAMSSGSFALVFTPANERSEAQVFGNIRELVNHLNDHFYWLDEAAGNENCKFIARDAVLAGGMTLDELQAQLGLGA